MICQHCETPVEPDQIDPYIRNGNFHHFCVVRMIVGSVGHQLGQCSCYGGTASDPPALTRREAAIAAFYLNVGRSKSENFANYPPTADCK